MKSPQMKPERWQQVEILYLAALEHEASQRGAFLAEACAEDKALRREVESLLRFHEQAGDFIEAPALEVAAQLQAANQNDSLVGRQLGPYQILSLLGVGGMGEVYRARDTRLDREVAIKVLPPHLAQDPQALARFKREAKAVAALSHPNILAIHDFATEQGMSYAVMELLEGETLRSRLKAFALPWRKAVEIGIALADGLAAAHAKGITHRDLKPENIFVTSDGHTKILDFGLAKLKPQQFEDVRPDASTPQHSTNPGTVMGTVCYMSPEQLRGEEASAPSDIFSFGCVFYEMVSGRRTFARPTAAETMAAILKDEPPELAETGATIPHELEQMVRHCLEKNPAERFQSARDLAFALRAMLSSAVASTPAPARSTRRIGPPHWIGAALLVILAAAITWWQPWQRAPSSQPQQRLISSFPGSHREASFSPDGGMIAFINDVGGVSQVWIKNLAQGDPVQITFGEVPAHRPRWSPNNDQIVFGRGPSLYFQDIWSVPPLGGNPRKVIEGGRNPNWSRDGSRLVYEQGDYVCTAKADGSEQRKLEGVPPVDMLLADRTPAYSPDGSLIAFFQIRKGPIGDIWVIPSAGGRPRQLTFDDSYGSAPVWLADSRYIAFSSQRAGSRTLWKVPASGGKPEPVLISAGEDTDPEISRDGTKLIYTNTRNSFIPTLMNLVTKQTRELSEVRNFPVDPSFSPQGDKIAFFALAEGGESHIFTLGVDGHNLTQVTRGKGELNRFPCWSPDGSILYFSQDGPIPSLRKISLSGGPSSEIARGWSWDAYNGALVDPTGKLLVGSKMENGETVATIIREIESGRETVFAIPLRYPRWSPDGKWIVGTSRSTGKFRGMVGEISICSVATRACRQLTKGSSLPRWSGDGLIVYFLRHGKSQYEEELWSISVTGEDEKQIGKLQVLGLSTYYDVSPKGEIVYVRFNLGKPELWLADFPRP